MDRFHPPHTFEAAAHTRIGESLFTWDADHPSADETLIAGCASYAAFNRYLEGEDLFLLPRNRRELEGILKRYAYDSIHNTIAKSRSPLETGGYSRVCNLAETSIRDVLGRDDNAAYLLSLHRTQKAADGTEHEASSPSRCIRT